LAEPDDAAVIRISGDQAIISTTDFFPPVVDHPYWFGAIAAANAMSDVYAMGGEVLMALNLVAFPTSLDMAILREILRGGAEMVKAAGGVLAGGHTVTDNEPKYGLAVTGTVHPDRILRKGGARPGDALVLTKPIGSGVITTALKNDKADPAHVEHAMHIMATLNRGGALAAQAVGVHAMTDITGYGLIGHSYEMAHLSGTRFHFDSEALVWMPGAREYAERGLFPGGQGRNRAYYSRWVSFDAKVDDLTRNLLYDPQTSGGLLIAVAGERLNDLLTDLAARDVAGVYIGDVQAGEAGITVH
jgi:selenide,water dikinase